MFKKTWLRLLLVIFLLLLGLACGISFSEQNYSEDELRLQLTVQALQMTQAVDSAKLAQADNAPPPAPAAPQESSPDSPAPQQQVSPEISGTPCNASKFVSETIPDGTNFNPGEAFSKTWMLRNNGSCKWKGNYVYEFEEGTRMDGESSIKLNTVIEPNETVTFKVNLKAPAANGTYTGVWRLKSDTGEKLGKYWVVINVGGGAPPAGPFAVTAVKLSVDAGADPKVFAKITVSAPGTVTYKWEDNVGATRSGSVTFNNAGTKTVETSINLGGGWVKIYIDEPNHQWFGPIDIP